MLSKKEYKIVALIPARSGSKGIEHKNIKLYKGKPLMVHSIEVALKSQYINNVYVSSDLEEYNQIALTYGAKITPLRDINISHDLSPDIDVFKHFINTLDKDEIPDFIVHLRPTYPNRTVEFLDLVIENFLLHCKGYDSLRTVIEFDKTPYKMYSIDTKNNTLLPFLKEYKDYIEPYNQARQIFPKTFLHNGCIDIVKTSVIINKHLLSGNKILPYIMNKDENNDIDDMNDFYKSECKTECKTEI
jgi:N-acylneuraminate cytidylyltransferase